MKSQRGEPLEVVLQSDLVQKLFRRLTWDRKKTSAAPHPDLTQEDHPELSHSLTWSKMILKLAHSLTWSRMILQLAHSLTWHRKIIPSVPQPDLKQNHPSAVQHFDLAQEDPPIVPQADLMQGESPVVPQPDLLYDNLSVDPQHELVQRDPSLKVTISWYHKCASEYEKDTNYHAEVVKYSACIEQMFKLWIENMMAG